MAATAKVKRKAVIKNYKLGYFVEPPSFDDGGQTFSEWAGSTDGKNTAQAVGQYGAAATNMLQPGNGDSNMGASIAGGALSGAGTGYKDAGGGVTGLIGAGIGLIGGAIYGGIESGKIHRAYETNQRQIRSNDYFGQRSNMTTTNIDPYGGQMAYGDFVPLTEDGGGDGGTKGKKKVTTPVYDPTKQPTYDPSLLTNGKFLVTKADGSIGQWGNNLVPQVAPIIPQVNPRVLQPSEYSRGTSSTFYDPNGQRTTPTPATIHPSAGSNFRYGGEIEQYSLGSSIGLPSRDAGKFYVPNAGLRRFAPHMVRAGKVNPLPSNNIDFSAQSQNTPQTMAYGANVEPNPMFGSDSQGKPNSVPTNSQQNVINIQKGELLINPQDGKILQNYDGVNPLTGGMFQPHSTGNQEESPNNYTLADPGLFVITKKTAGQYSTAMENNDKISQKTILMNIRNAKIAKEGGLKPKRTYADGDTVDSDIDVSRPDLMDYGTTPKANIPNASINAPAITNMYPIENGNSGPIASTQKNGFGEALDTVSKYGPALYNIGQGLFGQTQHQGYATPIINQDRNNVIANMPKNVDMSPIIRDIYASQALSNKSVQNQTNNSGVYRANIQNMNTNTIKATTNARIQAAELNNQAAGQRAYMYNALGYQGQQEQEKARDYNLNVDEINARRTAAKNNLLNAGLSQLQQTDMNDKENIAKAARDQQTIQSMLNIFPMMRYYYNADGTPKTR